MIGRSLNADLRKMKGTSVILAHLLIPIITSVIFLIYYFFSPWNKAFFGENYYLLTDALMSSKEASRIMKEEKKNPFLHLRILCPQRIWRC